MLFYIAFLFILLNIQAITSNSITYTHYVQADGSCLQKEIDKDYEFDVTTPSSGTFATVHKAKDLDFDVDVALKLIPVSEEGTTDHNNEWNILVELKALAFIGTFKTATPAAAWQAGIPQIFGRGKISYEGVEYHFICMEFLEIPLNIFGQIDFLTLVRFGFEMFYSIKYSHEHDVVHGDIKKENYMVRWVEILETPGLFRYKVFLVDFGSSYLRNPWRPNVSCSMLCMSVREHKVQKKANHLYPPMKSEDDIVSFVYTFVSLKFELLWLKKVLEFMQYYNGTEAKRTEKLNELDAQIIADKEDFINEIQPHFNSNNIPQVLTDVVVKTLQFGLDDSIESKANTIENLAASWSRANGMVHRMKNIPCMTFLAFVSKSPVLRKMEKSVSQFSLEETIVQEVLQESIMKSHTEKKIPLKLDNVEARRISTNEAEEVHETGGNMKGTEDSSNSVYYVISFIVDESKYVNIPVQFKEAVSRHLQNWLSQSKNLENDWPNLREGAISIERYNKRVGVAIVLKKSNAKAPVGFDESVTY